MSSGSVAMSARLAQHVTSADNARPDGVSTLDGVDEAGDFASEVANCREAALHCGAGKASHDDAKLNL